jgi:hypothetical protein
VESTLAFILPENLLRVGEQGDVCGLMCRRGTYWPFNMPASSCEPSDLAEVPGLIVHVVRFTCPVSMAPISKHQANRT